MIPIMFQEDEHMAENTHNEPERLNHWVMV